MGMDNGGEHTVQALEARGPRRRSRRPLHRPAAREPPNRCRRRAPPAVRARSRYRPYGARAGRPRAPDEIDGIVQSHLDGTSFAYVLGQGGEYEPDRHLTQHFEMLGSRAIYHDGWKAVTFHPVGPLYDDGLSPNAPFDDDVWELYHVAKDISEVHDRAAEFPDKVVELIRLWWAEARRNDVLPLDNRVLEVIAHGRPDRRERRETFRYFQGGAPVPETVAVNVRNRSHSMVLEVEVPENVVPNGTLLALGCALGGWSLHFLEGRLRYIHNLQGQTLYQVVAGEVLGPGRHHVEFRFEKDEAAGGRATLLQDSAVVGTGDVDRFTPAAFNEVGIGLTCGYEWGPAVGDDYLAPFPFSGTIVRAEVTATGPVLRDPVAEVAAILASQ